MSAARRRATDEETIEKLSVRDTRLKSERKESFMVKMTTGRAAIYVGICPFWWIVKSYGLSKKTSETS